MVKAAATELIRHLPAQTDKQASLFPPIADARPLGRLIAGAVGRQAIKDGHAQVADVDSLDRELDANVWNPNTYPTSANNKSTLKVYQFNRCQALRLVYQIVI